MSYRLEFNRRILDYLIHDSHAEFVKLVEKTAHDVEADAKRFIVENGQVDTGAMLNSVAVQDTSDDTKKQIVVGVEYGAVQELGSGELGAATGTAEEHGLTYNAGIKGQPARPFLAPAVENNRIRFYIGIERAVEVAGGK